jgi:hypothetical protein
MIKDILNDIFPPYWSFGDKCLATLMALGVLGLLAFIIVDSVGITPTKTTVTVVEEKQVVPAHTTYIMTGKIFIPQHHPKSYRLHFKIDGEEVSLTVEKKFFDDIKVGDKIEVDYGFGRLSNSRKPTKIRLVTR